MNSLLIPNATCCLILVIVMNQGDAVINGKLIHALVVRSLEMLRGADSIWYDSRSYCLISLCVSIDQI